MWQQHAYLWEHLHHSTPAAHLYIEQETGNLGDVLRRGPYKCPIEGGQEAECLKGLNLHTDSSTLALFWRLLSRLLELHTQQAGADGGESAGVMSLVRYSLLCSTASTAPSLTFISQRAAVSAGASRLSKTSRMQGGVPAGTKTKAGRAGSL